jgi:hypothetical protein
MSGSGNWTRAETLAALHIYLQLPFGHMNQFVEERLDLKHQLSAHTYYLQYRQYYPQQEHLCGARAAEIYPA